MAKRTDKERKVLRKGESQRKNGMYDQRWTSKDGKRHSVYAGTLEELREKEEKIICEVCGYANPKYTAICKKCSNYLTK